jgi:hypothetical protein
MMCAWFSAAGVHPKLTLCSCLLLCLCRQRAVQRQAVQQLAAVQQSQHQEAVQQMGLPTMAFCPCSLVEVVVGTQLVVLCLVLGGVAVAVGVAVQAAVQQAAVHQAAVQVVVPNLLLHQLCPHPP